MLLGKTVISEETRVTINIVTFLSIIALIITVVWGFASLKGDLDKSIIMLQADSKRIEAKFDSSIYDLHIVDENLIDEQAINREVNSDIKSRLSAIDANLIWIVEDMKND